MTQLTATQPADPSTDIRGWTSAEIKDRLPVQQKVIAMRAGVSEAFVSSVIKGKQKSRKVEVEIAKAVRVPRLTIWPDRKERKRGLPKTQQQEGVVA